MNQYPGLEKSERSREFYKYTEVEKAQVVYEYLFKTVSHRFLDENILGIPSNYSRGWQSMGILHYLGLKNEYKGLFKGEEISHVISQLTNLDTDFRRVAYYLSLYNSGIGIQNDLMLFRQNYSIPPLIKKVGSSQYTDGVRIEKKYHQLYNPPNSKYYTPRGKARTIKIMFNNKVFKAVYRYEGQTDKKIELQSIRYYKEMKLEFKRVFPYSEGEFSIVVGKDLNHFLFKDANDDVQEIEEAEEYSEGKVSYKLHKRYERNRKVVRKAKSKFWKKHGYYKCAACGFRFDEAYGSRGKKFIEGHHTKPISEMKSGEKTKVQDIALLCANCHRMIHKKPLITIAELSKQLRCT